MLHSESWPKDPEKDPARQAAHAVVAPTVEIMLTEYFTLFPTVWLQSGSQKHKNNHIYNDECQKVERQGLGQYPLRSDRIQGCSICKWKRLPQGHCMDCSSSFWLHGQKKDNYRGFLPNLLQIYINTMRFLKLSIPDSLAIRNPCFILKGSTLIACGSQFILYGTWSDLTAVKSGNCGP